MESPFKHYSCQAGLRSDAEFGGEEDKKQKEPINPPSPLDLATITQSALERSFRAAISSFLRVRKMKLEPEHRSRHEAKQWGRRKNRRVGDHNPNLLSPRLGNRKQNIKCFPSVFEANEQALKRKTIEKLQALKTLVDMGNKNGFNPSQEDNGQRRITGNYKNRFQALENLADMENKKSITPSQVEEDGSKKKKKKNKIQPETKTETCCSWLLLPLDIMTNILSRLTPKSIAKFLCACKQWLSLTHDARFLRSLHASSASYIIIGKYIVNGKIELYDFSMGDGGKPKKISYRLNLGSKDYRLSNFVDGLTCLHYGNGGPKPDIYLLNPMTRELQKLPKNNSHCEAYEYESFGLGVDMNMGLYKIVYGADVIDIVDGDILFRDYKSGRWNGISYNLCSGASHKLFLGGQQSDFAFYRESLISPKAVDGEMLVSEEHHGEASLSEIFSTTPRANLTS
ncbi:uncharacterized protein A4U43_C04F8500 [Asparagus officinalis]|uniref:F-box domain-containing protein n=1 Tax=Asparagus officinalis TaxID=4686 RepID=A0A5P1F453_ASPOF|nr:uncharacterized protein A4U43_C04F8500 [Asparagus officinalis]